MSRHPQRQASTELVIRDRRASAPVELRDPRGATLRSWYQSPTLPQVYEWDATQAFRLGYCANVIAYLEQHGG